MTNREMGMGEYLRELHEGGENEMNVHARGVER